ncbi:hypothetical protein ABT269_39750 [Streptomyces viridosporus]|uniref:hypothetical protein n=1 Tax=Streptomyces viridosporus TaxID=67581 RepID=UPI00332ED149
MPARLLLSARVGLALIGVGVAAVAGCSTADSTAKASDPGQSSKAAPLEKPLTEETLQTLVLQSADLPEARPGAISLQPRPDPADVPSFKPASDPDCQTVQDIRNATTAPAVVDQVINWSDNIWGGSVTLASYQDGEAARLFTTLKRAVGSCGAYRGDAWGGGYGSTMKAEKALVAGDEAVQFREHITMDIVAEDGKGTEVMETEALYIVVRTGSVIATYYSLDGGPAATAAFPTEPIIKQAGRLRTAQSR